MMDVESPQMSLDFEVKAPPVVDWRTSVPTVSQLTRRIRGQLENTFGEIWVRGEISNFRKPVSGHAYFCLKDATCQLKGVMFRPVLTKLKFQLQDGMEILLHGKVTVYEARGEYQMVCDTAEPVGVGALQLAFEQLKAKLHKEGLFDQKAKKKLPFLPRRIGVVTSATGAAVRDILKVLHRRFPERHIYILPASVQGERAAPEIVSAIELAQRWNRDNAGQAIDVLIVGRGGGSIEDLWPFNEEIVARSIFACTIPVISAVGHEIDFTIADFVADLRAPTPSAAAEIAVPKREELQFLASSHTNRLKAVTMRRLEQLRLHLGHLGGRLVDPRQKIRVMRETFKNLDCRMAAAMRSRRLMAQGRVERAAGMLDTLSPLRVVARGYTITRLADGTIVRSREMVNVGDCLLTSVGNGTVVSTVTETTDATLSS